MAEFFAIQFIVTLVIIAMGIAFAQEDYPGRGEQGMSLKPLMRPPPKPVFEQIAVMETLGLKLQRSSKGEVYAVGDDCLTIRSTGSIDDLIIEITVTDTKSLRSRKKQQPLRTVADIAQILVPENLAIRGMVRGVLKVDHAGNALIYQQSNSELDIEVLEHAINFTLGLVDAYSDIIALGGEIIPTLLAEAEQREFLAPFVKQALRDIGEETRSRLETRASRLICPACLARFGTITVDLPGKKLGTEIYIGCRMCGQGRKFLVGEMLAVLDESMAEPIETGIGSVRVSWLACKHMFDFDRVEIKRASDEAVERFAMQVGNDTDEVRRQRCDQIPCDVSCELSENTQRILRRTFAE